MGLSYPEPGEKFTIQGLSEGLVRSLRMPGPKPTKNPEPVKSQIDTLYKPQAAKS